MAKMTGMHKRRLGPRSDTRDLLLIAGVGQYVATLSAPYMFFLPRTSDPYAQGVIQIVQGLQRLLNEHGARLVVDGGMGKRTIAALGRFAGPRWYDKNWAQLYGDVISGEEWGGHIRKGRVPEEPLADYDYTVAPAALEGGVVGDLLASPVPWMAAAAFAWWKWFR